MTILETINHYKKREVASKKQAFPVSLLKQSIYFKRPSVSMVSALKKAPVGIIAEHKRKSPSKSIINDTHLVPEVVEGYELCGASGISVLTDTKFFGGSMDDLLLARQTTSIPLLRKEFIVDPYQIYEAKAFGADVILLIAASLSKKEVSEFSKLAKAIDLEVLVEIHNEEELEKAIHPAVDMIGVNNRNLKTFEVSIDNSLQLSEKIPSQFLKISESGIHSSQVVKKLISNGFDGFLMGEHFMKTDNPGVALKNFISEIV